MENNVKNILRRVSLGEGSKEDKEFLNSIPDEVFYSELEGLKHGQGNISATASRALDTLIEEAQEELRETLIYENTSDTFYSEIVPESTNLDKVKTYAKNRAIVRRFLKKKQRVK